MSEALRQIVRVLESLQAKVEALETKDRPATGTLRLTDGVTAPSAVVGYALIYVDAADGDLKIIFGDGTVKTIVVDT